MPSREKKRNEPRHTDICLWLDYYGALLSDRQRELLSLYYQEDWSLSEIADLTQLSRQGVHDQLRRGVARLATLESSLSLAARDRLFGSILARAREQEKDEDKEGLRQSLDELQTLMGLALEDDRGGDHGLI